jgi:hypothetical protein
MSLRVTTVKAPPQLALFDSVGVFYNQQPRPAP